MFLLFILFLRSHHRHFKGGEALLNVLEDDFVSLPGEQQLFTRTVERLVVVGRLV
jgi:hypothetical protein